jgi:cysteine sulfinate desulfinase/cysteine desulfurase-like protein
VLYTGTLQRGAVRDFTATGKLVVTFGNAGAVALTVNGHPLGAPGGSGQVVTVPFAPGDPAAG